jgi:hypothetical protein
MSVLGRVVIKTAKSGPKITRYFFAAGFLVPCLLFLIISVGDIKVVGFIGWGKIFLLLWPTFGFMMSAEAGGGALGEFFAFLISAAFNALVYSLVGSLVAFCYRRFVRPSGQINQRG